MKARKSTRKAAEVPPAAVEPGFEEIAALAHTYWEAAGRPEGDDVGHWLRAEMALRERMEQKKQEKT